MCTASGARARGTTVVDAVVVDMPLGPDCVKVRIVMIWLAHTHTYEHTQTQTHTHTHTHTHTRDKRDDVFYGARARNVSAVCVSHHVCRLEVSCRPEG